MWNDSRMSKHKTKPLTRHCELLPVMQYDPRSARNPNAQTTKNNSNSFLACYEACFCSVPVNVFCKRTLKELRKCSRCLRSPSSTPRAMLVLLLVTMLGRARLVQGTVLFDDFTTYNASVFKCSSIALLK